MANIISERSIAVILVFEVPPTVAEGEEVRLFVPLVMVGLDAIELLKLRTAKVSNESPEALAKRLLGPVLV